MKKDNILKRCIFFCVLAIILLLVVCVMVRYEVEGEKKLPFSVTKMLIVSTVDGQRVEDESNIWNIDIRQVNDIYMYINKTANNTDELIKEISVENFQILKSPQRGQLKVYRPTGELENLYQYSQQDYLNTKITYIGEQIDDIKALEVSSTGGMIGFRVSLDELGKFISNESEEISYDGSLLKNINVNNEEIKTSIMFDLIIETNENIKYKGTFTLELPKGNIIEEGSSSLEITDFSDIIFKRI